MIKVNFTDGVEVMTSSTHLYQWDSNQEITISGLNIANASVHFTNKKRNDAIVVNGTKNNNSLVADIPNILLEDDLDIIAYVHVIASNKGNTIKVVKIPKIARQKPSDYQFTQNIEIMNFERLQSDFNELADECHEVLDQIQRELITVDGEGAESDGSHSVIKPRRATVNEWVNANTILANGEIAVEVPADGVGSGISKFKIGDGVTAWNDLPYAVDNPQGAIDELSDNVADVQTQLDNNKFGRADILLDVNVASGSTEQIHKILNFRDYNMLVVSITNGGEVRNGSLFYYPRGLYDLSMPLPMNLESNTYASGYTIDISGYFNTHNGNLVIQTCTTTGFNFAKVVLYGLY